MAPGADSVAPDAAALAPQSRRLPPALMRASAPACSSAAPAPTPRAAAASATGPCPAGRNLKPPQGGNQATMTADPLYYYPHHHTHPFYTPALEELSDGTYPVAGAPFPPPAPSCCTAAASDDGTGSVPLPSSALYSRPTCSSNGSQSMTTHARRPSTLSHQPPLPGYPSVASCSAAAPSAPLPPAAHPRSASHHIITSLKPPCWRSLATPDTTSATCLAQPGHATQQRCCIRSYSGGAHLPPSHEAGHPGKHDVKVAFQARRAMAGLAVAVLQRSAGVLCNVAAKVDKALIKMEEKAERRLHKKREECGYA